MSMQSELQAKRACKASFAEEELDDTPFGYQIMLGVDYALTDTPMRGSRNAGLTMTPSATEARYGIHCVATRLRGRRRR